MRRAVLASLVLGAIAVAALGEGDFGWLLRLSNDNVLDVKVTGLDGSELVVVPKIAPETSVRVDPEQVVELARRGDWQPPELPGLEWLAMRDGSELRGTLVSLSSEEVVFEVVPLSAGSGPFVVSLAPGVVDSVARGKGFSRHALEVEAGPFVVAIGGLHYSAERVELDESGFRMVGEGGPRQVDYRLVDGIVFPAGARSEAGGSRYEIRLRNGSRLFAAERSLSGGRLVARLPEGGEIGVPFAEVSSVGFRAVEAASSRRIVALWGRFADRDEEYANTLASIRGGLPEWSVEESFSSDFGPDFRRNLMQARTLVIPEMEEIVEEEARRMAGELRPLVRQFVERGGNIVLLGVDSRGSSFLRAAELFELEYLDTYDPMVEVAEGSRFAERLPFPEFPGPNATYSYEPFSSDAEVWARDLGGEGAVVLARQVGRGWIVVIGMDYYESSPEADQVLIEAIRFSG